MHEGLMDSEGHRDNILDPNAAYVGIGLAVGNIALDGIDYDVVYLTQNFADTDGRGAGPGGGRRANGPPALPGRRAGRGPAARGGHRRPRTPPKRSRRIPDEEEEQASEIRLRRRMLRGHRRLRQLVPPGRRGPAPFRDEVLVRHPAGRAFIRAYRVVGPKLARLVSPEGALRPRRAGPHLAPGAPAPGTWTDRRR